MNGFEKEEGLEASLKRARELDEKEKSAQKGEEPPRTLAPDGSVEAEVKSQRHQARVEALRMLYRPDEIPGGGPYTRDEAEETYKRFYGEEALVPAELDFFDDPRHPNESDRGVAQRKLMAKVLFNYEEPEDAEAVQRIADNLGASVEFYMANRALLQGRLERDSFKEVSKGFQLKAEVLKESQAMLEANQELLAEIENPEGQFSDLKDEERAEMRAFVMRKVTVETFVIGIGQSPPEAQKDFYDLIVKTEDPDVSIEELTAEAVVVAQKHRLTPEADQQNKQRQQTEESEEGTLDYSYGSVTEEEKQEASETLGVDEKSILGKNAHGDLIIDIGDGVCGFDLQGNRVEWFNVEIGGELQPLQRVQVEHVDNAGAFNREIGRARVQAALARHALPFTPQEQDRFVEIVLRQSGDVKEFTYGSYNDDTTQEATLLDFLEAMTPVYDSAGTGTLGFLKELGVVEGGRLNKEGLEEVAALWQEKRHTMERGKFQKWLLEKTE